MASKGFWATLASVATVVATGVAILTFLRPAEPVVIPPPEVRIDPHPGDGEKFGFEIDTVYLWFIREHLDYERYFFNLFSRAITDGYEYAFEVVLTKYDDTSYQNCEAMAPGFGRIYLGLMSVNSREGIQNDYVFPIGFEKGRYRVWFTMVSSGPQRSIDELAKGKFSLTCDSMTTLDHPIDVSRVS